jgi:hypothetical protein
MTQTDIRIAELRTRLAALERERAAIRPPSIPIFISMRLVCA